MAHYYYLANGKNSHGNALDVLVDGKLVRNFEDISTLDLQTLNIDSSKAKQILKEYNPEVDLSGMFYDLSYPHKDKEFKSYAPIFNMENDEVKYYQDKLRYFAEQRNYKKEHKQKIKLDVNQEFEDFIRTILYNILNQRDSKLTDYESLIAPTTKELFRERFVKYNMSTNNYINSKIFTFRSLLSNYTELRNLVLEYMLYISGYNTNIRSKIKATKNWNNSGVEVLEPVSYDKKEVHYVYEQMDLFDFDEFKSKNKVLRK